MMQDFEEMLDDAIEFLLILSWFCIRILFFPFWMPFYLLFTKIL